MVKKMSKKKVLVSGLRIVTFLVVGLVVVSCAPRMYKNTFVVAGTYLEVTSPDSRAAEIVYQEFKRLNDIFNTYDLNSEVSRLNMTVLEPFQASEDLIAILKLSREITELTNGSFDVSQGVLYKFWKGLIDKGSLARLPSEELIEGIKNLGGMEEIEINFDTKIVNINKRGVIIDLGAIAKGYMVDQALAKLRAAGITSALINAGGDMYALGLNNKQSWKVGIRDPQEAESLLTTLELTNKAVATSGNYEQFFEHQGKVYSHLIDPRSGYPVSNDIVSVSVISSSCAISDSLATAFFVGGFEEINKFLAKNPLKVRILVVTEGASGRETVFLGQDDE